MISVASADEPASPPPDAAPTRAELEELKAQNAELRDELELLKEDLTQTDQRASKLAPLAARVTGYLDFGFFVVEGDGTGIRPDLNYERFPEYENIVQQDSWVFLGDPLSTAINSRGEPASTGESRAITFDPIRTKGPTFLLNSLNIGLFANVGSSTILQAKLDIVPRGRDISTGGEGLFLGDYADLRLAYVEHRITREWMELSLFAGKFDSVIGFEYRSQEAPTRIEVTPSLICRYTCGYPLGLKARALFLDQKLGVNVAVTNGSSFSEQFAFYNEVDKNEQPTGAGRLHVQPIRGLELGVSGSWGAQDYQEDSSIRQWMYGVDFHFHRHDLVLRAEFVQGRAKGKTSLPTDPRQYVKPCNEEACLQFKGAYGLVGYRLTNIVMPYVRVDWRDALHRKGTSFVYISELARLTPGLRLALTHNLVLKAEYTLNVELGRLPQIPNNLFTSSLVISY